MKDKMNVLFLSNMIAEKGVWTIVEAAKVLHERGIKLACHFVGKWSDITEDMFRKAIAEYHLEDVCFAYGGKYGKEKDEFWNAADVFVFPTFYHNECFPLVLLEAMQHHLPCISTNEGGIPGIIKDGETGFLIEKHDFHALADKLELLCLHPDVCKNMGEKGYQKFSNEFTLRKFEERMVEILGEAVYPIALFA